MGVRKDTRAYQVQRHAAHQEHLGNQSHSASSPSVGANHARSFSTRAEAGSAFERLERRRDPPQASFRAAVPVDAVVPVRRVPSVPVDAHQSPDECINKVARSWVLGFASSGQPLVTQRPHIGMTRYDIAVAAI